MRAAHSIALGCTESFSEYTVFITEGQLLQPFVKLFMVNAILNGVLEILSCLKLACLPNHKSGPHSEILFKWLSRGKWEFLSPSSETYLRLTTLWTPLDYLYLVSVLHRHL